MTENSSPTPDRPDTTAPTATLPEHAVAPEPTPSEPARPARRSRGRIALLAGGAVLVAAALAGGGIAVGAALADDEDDDDRASSQVSEGDATDDALPADAGASSADDLVDVVAVAAAAAAGAPTSLEAEADGSWDVTLRSDDGTETEVRVTGTRAEVRASDTDDEVAAGSLDAESLRALVSAARAHTDGRVVEIDVDDDAARPYDVTVLTADAGTVEIALDADFAVIEASR